MGGVAYYPTDDWKLSLDVSSLDGYNSIEFGSEYLLRNFELPVAVTGTAHLGQDGAARFMLGLRGYFGPDPDKSLLRRHREDDPSDRAVGLMTAVGSSHSTVASPVPATQQGSDGQSTTPPPVDQPPTAYQNCVAQGGDDEFCSQFLDG
jgi:hypothetical protein